MTNFDRVKQEMRIEDVAIFGGLPCKIIHKLKNEENCSDRACTECQKWLAEEYVEPITLTEAERVILENIDKDFRYIARETNGNLCVYKDRPTRGIYTWTNGIITIYMGAFNHLFQFIKWENEEPYEIAELLKEE